MPKNKSAVAEAPVKGKDKKSGATVIVKTKDLAKAKTVPKATTPAKAKKASVNVKGNLRGVAKHPDSWKPEKQLMPKMLEAVASGKKGLALAPFLNPAQTRALTLLAKAKGPVQRASFLEPQKYFEDKPAISSESYVGVWVGRTDAESREESESKWGYVSLVTLGFVKVDKYNDNDKAAWCYEITPQGRKALEAKTKADAAKAKE